jgi:hypothetical protein
MKGWGDVDQILCSIGSKNECRSKSTQNSVIILGNIGTYTTLESHARKDNYIPVSHMYTYTWVSYSANPVSHNSLTQIRPASRRRLRIMPLCLPKIGLTNRRQRLNFT